MNRPESVLVLVCSQKLGNVHDLYNACLWSILRLVQVDRAKAANENRPVLKKARIQTPALGV